jgi:hypothetical protein
MVVRNKGVSGFINTNLAAQNIVLLSPFLVCYSEVSPIVIDIAGNNVMIFRQNKSGLDNGALTTV